MNYYNYGRNDVRHGEKYHTHEALGNTGVAETGRDAHVHRIAGITGEPIPVTGGHIHELRSYTTFDDNHIHSFGVKTGISIPIGEKDHIHLLQGKTTVDDDHNHNYSFYTLV